MLRCQDVVAMLCDAQDGTLEPARQRQAKDHLAQCPDCRNFQSSYQLTMTLSAKALRVTLPESAKARIQASLRQRLTRAAG